MNQQRAPYLLPARRPRPMALAVAAVAVASCCFDSAAAETCGANASTLFRGATDRDAIAYNELCVARNFRVLDEPNHVVSLNLSHLNLVGVHDYPPVNKLLLHDNFLTTFQTPTTESLMEELDLHNNLIADLTVLQLPRRLSKLNLAKNKISILTPAIPWPAAFELKWLSLDGNGINEIAATAFGQLATLSYLSLSGTSLEKLGDLTFPLTLSTLNLSNNNFRPESLVFATAPVALQTLDLSGNHLSKFPDLSAFSSLVDLNLANNNMTYISVRLPPKLKRLNLSMNSLENIEIAQSDIKIIEKLESLELSVDALGATCTNEKAKRQIVREGIAVCVLSDDIFNNPSTGSAPPSSLSPDTTTHKPGVLNDTNSTDTSSSGSARMSSKAMLLLAGGCFGMGLIVAVYVFLVRRDGRAISNKPSQHPTFAPDASDTSSRTFGRSGSEKDDRGEYSNASWVFEVPTKNIGGLAGMYNNVAILEDDPRRRGHGLSKVEDLLVFEIPLDEILVKEAMTQKLHGLETMYKAEYQGFQVVMHTLSNGRNKLQRGHRRFEREFIERVRLASMLEHVSIVQFVGITLGAQKHPNFKWKMGVVFEYMGCGSLASIFHEERTRRERKRYLRKLSDAASTSTKNDSDTAFTWYPNALASSTESGSSTADDTHRSKLSIALDVAMALSYLHSMGYAHGDLCAQKVLVNEQGEAKLSGMDIDLALNVPETSPTHIDVRSSAVKARMKVKHIFQTSISHSPALGSSLLDSAAAANGGIMPMAPTSLTNSTMLVSAHSRARRRGMHGDIYAFGLLLWELDTTMCVDAMKRLTASATEIGEDHLMLRFSPECPSEIQYLARRCWNPELKDRPTALDLQEEIVRLLEGRLTTLSQRSRSTNRWSRRTNSRNGSSSFASSHSSLSTSDYRSSSLVISETEV